MLPLKLKSHGGVPPSAGLAGSGSRRLGFARPEAYSLSVMLLSIFSGDSISRRCTTPSPRPSFVSLERDAPVHETHSKLRMLGYAHVGTLQRGCLRRSRYYTILVKTSTATPILHWSPPIRIPVFCWFVSVLHVATSIGHYFWLPVPQRYAHARR
jgi:hypothetical protein